MPHRLYLWLDAWVAMLDSVITLLSFTLINTTFSYKLAVWQAYKIGHKKAIAIIEDR